ncbi:MAG TPA: YkvA family protein [Gammaproteobacteria bacterium]|nr:YkvA family protein [Gammaproteobacteria bacterium]
MAETTAGPTEAPPRNLRQRLWGYLRRASGELAEKVLILYYTLDEPELPAWARSTIYGALLYFLSPWDATPDFIAGVGFTDDLGVLTAALATVAAHVTPEARRRARERLDGWR